MTIQEEREWWEMRIKYPFVGDMQEKLDEFQRKLIDAGEPPIHVESVNSGRLCKSVFGFEL